MKHTAPISGVAVGGNDYVATAGYDNQLILWRAEDKTPLAQVSHDHLVNQCAFSPDGRSLISASSDYSARIWSVPDMRLLHVLTAHNDDVMQALYSPDGCRVATSSYDGSLAVYDAQGQLQTRLLGHRGLIESFDWDADSQRLHSCGTDGTIRTWQVETGECVAIRNTDGHDSDALVTLNSGAYIYGNNDGTLGVVHRDGRVARYAGHQSGVKRLVLNAAQTQVLSVGYDRQVFIWCISAGDELHRQSQTRYPDEVWARSAAFLNGDQVVFATFGSCYAVWNLKDNTWDLQGIEPSKSLNAVNVIQGQVYATGDAGVVYRNGVALGGLGSLSNFVCGFAGDIISGGQTGEIYSLKLGRVFYHHHAPHNCAVEFQRGDAAMVAVGSYSGHVLLFSAQDGDYVLHKALPVHVNAIKGMACDGHALFTGCASGELGVIDLDSLEVSRVIPGAHESIMNGISRYRDGIATISRDLTLRLWQAGGESLAVKSRHRNSIKCVAADSQGQWIATGSYGGTVDVYDVAAGAWVGRIKRPTMAGISSLAWCADQHCFLAASYDGVIYPIPLH